MAEDDLRFIDNRSLERYELRLGESVVGFIAYETEPGAVVLLHTEVDPGFEGRGFGSRLVAGAFEDIRARRLSVVPICPFVSSYLRRHPEDADLVARDPATMA
jgi:predicted GNAT family acetyltransferase